MMRTSQNVPQFWGTKKRVQIEKVDCWQIKNEFWKISKWEWEESFIVEKKDSNNDTLKYENEQQRPNKNFHQAKEKKHFYQN